MTDDLRWRDLSQHEGPAEPPWSYADNYPEDGPNPGPICHHHPSACMHTYEDQCADLCEVTQQALEATITEHHPLEQDRPPRDDHPR